MSIDLDGKRFQPVSNSEGGRVTSDAVFTFQQSGEVFSAVYAGAGFTDGHLIGRMTGRQTADLVYHCRALDGSLEVGEASAQFGVTQGRPLSISMDWQWLNGTKASGSSYYLEVADD